MRLRSEVEIELSEDERTELERRARSQRAAHRSVVRAKIILGLARGQAVAAVARDVHRSRQVVRYWGRRFLAKRLDGLEDLARSGRPPTFSPGSGPASGKAGLRAA